MAEFVVGIDGSESSIRAARWAAGEAVLRSATLRLICAYDAPATWLGMGEALGATMTMSISEDDLHSYGSATLEDAVAKIEVPDGVEVIRQPQMGKPANLLIAASKTADLLVIGSRGHGDLGGVLLGSTSMHCVHHAQCPVVVIPHNAA